jgi:chorismate mutase
MINTKILKTLKAARRRIDAIDRQIILQLSKRMAVSQKIGKLKKTNKIPIIQKARWSDLMGDRFKKSKKLGLNLKFVDVIFRIIQKESIAIQRNVKSK